MNGTQPVFYFYSAPSGPPVNIVTEVNSSRVILLQWDPPLIQDQNGIIISYRVNVTSIVGGERFNFETADNHLFVTGLTPHTIYECIISAVTRVGTGPFSGIVTVQTSAEGNY